MSSRPFDRSIGGTESVTKSPSLLSRIPAGFLVGGIVFLAIIVFMFFSALWPWHSVPTGSRGVVTQYGRIVRIEPEGLVTLPPWQALSIFSVRAEEANIDKATAATRDQQPVDTSLTVRYRISPNKVAEVFEQYSHTGDLSSFVQTATQESFKAVTARYEATELLSNRAQVSNDIQTALQTKLTKYGADVINIDMRMFEWTDPTYAKAINDKVRQEQLRQAAENQLKTVEAQQKQKTAVAEADASAQKAKADGDAYALVTQAKAEAEQTRLNANAQADSIKAQQAALSQGQGVLELKRIQVEQTKAERWSGQLPQAIYGASPALYMNVNPAQLQK